MKRSLKPLLAGDQPEDLNGEQLTMKLSFIKSHKSISSFPDIELPDFVVLTGVNGAGKSHLLEAIENGSMQIDDIAVNPQTRPIRRFDWTNLFPQDTGPFSSSQITQEQYGIWSELSQHIKDFRPQIVQALQQFHQIDLGELKIREIIGLTPEDLIAKGSTPEQAQQTVQAIQNASDNATQNITNIFIRNDINNRPRLLSLLQNNASIPLIAFEENDFYKFFPKSWQPVEMFQQSFSRLFVDYQRSWRDNQLRQLGNSKGESISFLTDQKFLENYGEPPWGFVNSVLEAANLDFRIDQPEKYEDRPYEPKLTDQIRKTQVRFDALSSGERVLMSFALCLYYAEDHRQIVDYPKILLFDEIDAPLHPSMTQSLLSTIQKVLVKQHGIRVILTTHSPSTVALSPEESLYAMSKTEQRRMQKSTKDKALAILTTGVPTLSINYENRRQIFVESHYDAQFYERLYEKLKDHLIPEVSLSFIPSGSEGEGGCKRVKDVVNQLERGGNRTVYGIIDWDLTNSGNERIKVLGKGSRYSIENYLFDPVLVAALLLREKFIDRSTIGLKNNETYIHFDTFDSSQLQGIADFVVNNVKAQIHPQESEDDKLQCQYLGGQTINLPKWYLQAQGHQLEESLKQTFRELGRFQREPQLKVEIIEKVIDDIPSLIPYDLVLLFKEVQKVIGA